MDESSLLKFSAGNLYLFELFFKKRIILAKCLLLEMVQSRLRETDRKETNLKTYTFNIYIYIYFIYFILKALTMLFEQNPIRVLFCCEL